MWVRRPQRIIEIASIHGLEAKEVLHILLNGGNESHRNMKGAISVTNLGSHLPFIMCLVVVMLLKLVPMINMPDLAPTKVPRFSSRLVINTLGFVPSDCCQELKFHDFPSQRPHSITQFFTHLTSHHTRLVVASWEAIPCPEHKKNIG